METVFQRISTNGVQYCNKRQINSFHPSVDNVIEFLSELFHSGYSYETRNSARSALSS